MSKNTGGPAFPVHDPFAAHQPRTVDLAQRLAEGMTLRDYFAAKAMAPMVAHRVAGHVSYGNEQDIAKRAYEFADAMLAERAA